MTTGIKWWGYMHTNNTPQVKRFFSNEDLSEAMASPFCQYVSGIHDTREEVLTDLERIAASKVKYEDKPDKVETLQAALKEILQYVECTDGRRGCLVGCAVSTFNYNEWNMLAKGGKE